MLLIENRVARGLLLRTELSINRLHDGSHFCDALVSVSAMDDWKVRGRPYRIERDDDNNNS